MTHSLPAKDTLGTCDDLLRSADLALRMGLIEEALRMLGQALGAAKREGRPYAAGRILTAIKQARRIGQ